jgi:spore maturation protein B
MTNYIIPSIVLFIIIYGFIKKVDIYDEFLNGVIEGLSMSLKIFPTMFAMTIGINVLLSSNIINDITNFITPILNLINYPKELVPLAIMRPISGSSSLIIMDSIFKNNGPDSFIGRVASVLQGSTDTTIYIISLYFSSVGIKKIKYSLIVGLLADLMAIIISIVVVKSLF